jgi:hypothetical protein
MPSHRVESGRHGLANRVIPALGLENYVSMRPSTQTNYFHQSASRSQVWLGTPNHDMLRTLAPVLTVVGIY